MPMALNGRRKATSATKDRRKDQYPSMVSAPYEETCKNENNNDDANVSGDYGIILVKKYRKARSSSFVEDEPKKQMPNHRGVIPKANKKNETPERFFDVVASFLCGVCASEKSVLHEEPSMTNTTFLDDSSQESGDGERPNAILLRQNQFLAEEELKHQEESILTDVSFLTDGSPTDLDLKDLDDEEMPCSSNNNNKIHALPAFRKPPVMRKTQQDEPMPSDLLKHTRKNPLWKEKMGVVFKKPYQNKKQKSSSSKKKKRFPLTQDKIERKRLV